MTKIAKLALLLLATASAPMLLGAAPTADCDRRPASLRGTAVDGDLTTDARGRFVPTLGARRFFDYFLTATGEEPVEAIRTRVVAEISLRLSEPAASEAIRHFDLYLAYLDRARELAPLKGKLDEESALGLLSDLRRDVLGREAAAAFFGEDEEADRAALRRRALGLREEPESALSVPASRVDRERLFGADAAGRLEALDTARAAFRARVAAYRAERRAIEASEGDAALRAAAVGRLLEARFSAPERLRVEALDRIEAR